VPGLERKDEVVLLVGDAVRLYRVLRAGLNLVLELLDLHLHFGDGVLGETVKSTIGKLKNITYTISFLAISISIFR